MKSYEPPPRVSIGLPVHNGQQYLQRTIDSLLGQTFGDFELILCDNASDDRTQQICREFASRDPRVRYYRSAYRMTTAENFSRAFHLSRGHYFKWAPDESCDVRLLEESVRTLDADPSAVMVYAGEGPIGSDREPLGTDSPLPARRYRTLIFGEHRESGRAELFGVYRRSVLARTNLFALPSRDQIPLLVRCALMGRFIRIEGGVLKQREPRPASIDVRSTPPEVMLPDWVIACDFLHAISQTPISRAHKYLCRFWWALFVARNANKFSPELLVAAKHAFKHASHRRRRRPLVPEHRSRRELDFDRAHHKKSAPQIDAGECSRDDAGFVVSDQMPA